MCSLFLKIVFISISGADVHVYTKEGDSPLYLATFGILNSPFIDVGVLTDLVKAGSYSNCVQ